MELSIKHLLLSVLTTHFGGLGGPALERRLSVKKRLRVKWLGWMRQVFSLQLQSQKNTVIQMCSSQLLPTVLKVKPCRGVQGVALCVKAGWRKCGTAQLPDSTHQLVRTYRHARSRGFSSGEVDGCPSEG